MKCFSKDVYCNDPETCKDIIDPKTCFNKKFFIKIFNCSVDFFIMFQAAIMITTAIHSLKFWSFIVALDQQRLKKIKMIVLQIGIFRSKKRKERRKKWMHKKTLKCPRDVFLLLFPLLASLLLTINSHYKFHPSFSRFCFFFLQLSSISFCLQLDFTATFLFSSEWYFVV